MEHRVKAMKITEKPNTLPMMMKTKLLLDAVFLTVGMAVVSCRAGASSVIGIAIQDLIVVLAVRKLGRVVLSFSSASADGYQSLSVTKVSSPASVGLIVMTLGGVCIVSDTTTIEGKSPRQGFTRNV
ncbi:hypothetical protein J1614_002604 [Plenodomus biglobosus]|nr:hypothetical protein J1614_002604 [Plenodomus biglobosus]